MYAVPSMDTAGLSSGLRRRLDINLSRLDREEICDLSCDLVSDVTINIKRKFFSSFTRSSLSLPLHLSVLVQLR